MPDDHPDIDPSATRGNVWARLRSLNDALDQLREELTSLAACSEALQDAIGELPLRAPPSGRMLRRVQAADLLTQRLHALTRYADALRSAAPPDWPLAENWCTASPIGVRSCNRIARHDDEHVSSGEFELF